MRCKDLQFFSKVRQHTASNSAVPAEA